jgi:hypothetical protein
LSILVCIEREAAMIAPRFVLLLLFILAAAAGCQKRDPSVALLEAENRWLEDQVYAMEDHITWQEAQLESCRRENSALRDEVNDETGASLPGTGSGPPSGGVPGLPEIEIPGSSGQPDIDFGAPAVPEIDFGTPSQDGPEFGDPLPGDTGAAGRTQQDATHLTSLARNTAKPATPADQTLSPPGDANQVDRIVLNRQLTGGKNFDDIKGDDGIMIVVEPQDASGQYLSAAAPVAVVVLDPYKSGKAAYVARWNFDTVDTAGLLRKSALGRGIYLNLPWPNQPPEHSQLKLYVRYLTPDGRKLGAQKDITVDVPVQVSDRRTPAGQAATDVRQDGETTDTDRAVTQSPPQPKNPLRPKSVAKRPSSERKNHTFDTGDTALRLPPNHNPNELPPRWHPNEAAGDGADRSVLVRRDAAGADDEVRDERVEQALRPRPWSPQR